MAEQQPTLDIQRIYLKDASLESPAAPDCFTKDWNPEVNIDLDVKDREIGKNLYEVVLSITVHAKEKDQPIFLVEVHQAGIFHLEGFPDEHKDHILGSYFPSVLFPYAREAVSDLVGKASFPQLNLAPVNFDAIYMQKNEAAKGKKEESPIITDTTKH